MRLLHLALVTPKTCKTDGGAEFPGFGLLLTCDSERSLEMCLRFRRIGLRRLERDLPGNAMEIGFTSAFLGSLYGRHHFADATPCGPIYYGFSGFGLAAVLSAILAASGLFAALLSEPKKRTAADKAAADNVIADEGADKVAADKTAMDKAAAACAAAASLATGRSSITSRQPITSDVVRIRVRTAL